jgi:chitinase
MNKNPSMKAILLAAYVMTSFAFAQQQDPVKGVKNLPPQANAGTDLVFSSTDIVQLDGTASREPDGIISRYHWLQLSGTPVSIANQNAAISGISNIKPGEYKFLLTVTDEKGSIATDELKVTIRE